jgi:hypothetical protein
MTRDRSRHDPGVEPPGRLRHLAAGQAPEQIVDEYPELQVEDVRDCLRYAAWLASGRSVELSGFRGAVAGDVGRTGALTSVRSYVVGIT